MNSAGEPLRIAGVRLVRSGGALANTVQNARRAWRVRTGVVIEVRDDAGHLGVGEASPLPGFSRETLEDCVHALSSIDAGVLRCDESGWPELPGPALAELPAALFAWECAVADLLSRRRGCSVATLLGGKLSAQRIPLCALIATEGDWVEAGRAALARGISTLKVKVGRGAVQAELAALAALRSTLGDDFRLRLDANGSWSIAEARARLEQLAQAQLKIEFIEQPVAPGRLIELGPCALPWAADESLQDPAEARALEGVPGCAAWILKPAAVGLLRARELGLSAAAQGLGVVVTHLFDGPIGLAAACELALSLPQPAWACGLDVHAGLAAWPEVALPHFDPADGASFGAHGRSGLGFSIDGVPWS